MAKKTRYYAVVHGKPSGIFNVWEGGAAPATQGVENAVFKSFTTLEHAEEWYRQNVPPTSRYLSPVYHFETQSVQAGAPHTPIMETLEGFSPGRHVVFTISNPENNEPFYVGETLNPERSEARHLSGTSRKRNGIALKVRELQAQGIRPVFNIVEHYDSKEAALEGKTRLVKAYVQQGFELVNKTREHREIQELYRAPAVRLDTVIGDTPFDLGPYRYPSRQALKERLEAYLGQVKPGLITHSIATEKLMFLWETTGAGSEVVSFSTTAAEGRPRLLANLVDGTQAEFDYARAIDWIA